MKSLVTKYKIAKIDWDYKDLVEATGISFSYLVKIYLGYRPMTKGFAKKLVKANIIKPNKKELKWINETSSQKRRLKASIKGLFMGPNTSKAERLRNI